MVRCVFADFDEFADAIKGLDGRYIPTARSSQQWWIDPIRIDTLTLQQIQVGGAATFAGHGEPNELCIGIPVSNPAAISIDGGLMPADSFILVRNNLPLTYSSQATTRWAGVTLPLQAVTDLYLDADTELGIDMLGETLLRADPAALRRVSLLVALLCSGNDTINIVDPAAVAAAQEDTLMAATALLRSSTYLTEQRLGRPPVARDRIIARCLEYVREKHGQPILVSELCHLAQVSERTLRNIFYEYFGVGPVRFLKLRQLQEVRSALLTTAAVRARQSVTSIATRFGVWDFNLFSRNYRAIYGETPSQTLRGARPHHELSPRRQSLKSMQSWMKYASMRFTPVAMPDRASIAE